MIEVTWEDGVFGGLAILGGLFLCFAGFRLFKPAVFASGTFLGYILMYSILLNTDAKDDQVAVVMGSLGFGIVCGLLLVWMVVCVAKIVLFLLGFLAGFTLAIYIMSWSGETILIESTGWRWGMIVALSLLCGILAVFVKKFFIIAATAWYGSFFVFYGKENSLFS